MCFHRNKLKLFLVNKILYFCITRLVGRFKTFSPVGKHSFTAPLVEKLPQSHKCETYIFNQPLQNHSHGSKFYFFSFHYTFTQLYITHTKIKNYHNNITYLYNNCPKLSQPVQLLNSTFYNTYYIVRLFFQYVVYHQLH